MIQDKIFFDEKDPTGLSYNTPFTFYGSYQGRLWSKSPSGSIQYYTQNSDLSAYATTGSNQFSGSQTVTGSLTVTGTITGTVAGTTSTASYVEYTNVANKPALISGSAQVTSFGIFATTGSNGFNGSQSITGSLTVTGQVVAQTLNVQQVTSSIVYSSGSNIFGNSLANTQQFTGSVSITGSLTTSIAAFGSAASLYLVSDSGIIKSRTAAQTLSDIAALPLAGGTLTGALNGTSATFSGTINSTITNALVLSNNSSTTQYVYTSLANSVGNARYGVDNSTGGGLGTGTSANSAVFGNAGNADVDITTNNISRLKISSTGAATFSSSVTANSTINGYFGGITTGQTPATSGTTPVNPMLNLTNNRGIGMYFGGSYAGNYAQWIQVSDTGNLGVNYPLLLNPNGGNVGIGTPSPSINLQIAGTNNNAVGVSTFWSFNFVGQEITNLSNTANTVAGLTLIGGSGRASVSAIGNVLESTTLGALAFFTGGSGVGGGTVPERMRITSDGNVLIGTTSNPGQKMHVYSSGTTRIRVDGAGNNSGVLLAESGANKWSIATVSNDLVFYNEVASSTQMRIASSGAITTPFNLGKAYSQTSGAGTGTSIVDTGITYDTGDFGGYSRGATYQVVFNGNPNQGGSSAYFAQYTGIIMIYTGWNGSAVTTYIEYTQLAAGNNIGGLTLTPRFWNGSSEVSSIGVYTGGYQIRLKISGYNSGYTGADQTVYLKKIS